MGDVVRRSCGDDPRVLDLGAGTGLLSAHVRAAVPGARLHLVDGSEQMLAGATARLAHAAHPPIVVEVRDLAGALPDGPFDAVVSSLAIHHLADDDKRALFVRIADVLVDGGVFVHLEQVRGPDDVREEWYADAHERSARASGSDDEEWAGAVERMRADRSATLDSQLEWLRVANFFLSDVVAKDWRFVVYAAWKHPARRSEKLLQGR
ncbi:MAG TPA: class I SAM-dependent methyltransferase [Mycobacteriales bacterium]|nr:class I SAM-dependent methyltransferase [Mycobacteriales bacterium]